MENVNTPLNKRCICCNSHHLEGLRERRAARAAPAAVSAQSPRTAPPGLRAQSRLCRASTPSGSRGPARGKNFGLRHGSAPGVRRRAPPAHQQPRGGAAGHTAARFGAGGRRPRLSAPGRARLPSAERGAAGPCVRDPGGAE